jgi:hypothetical protein
MTQQPKCDWCRAPLMLLTEDESGCGNGPHARSYHVTVETDHMTWSVEPGASTEFCDHDCAGPDDEYDVCDQCKAALAAFVQGRRP